MHLVNGSRDRSADRGCRKARSSLCTILAQLVVEKIGRTPGWFKRGALWSRKRLNSAHL